MSEAKAPRRKQPSTASKKTSDDELDESELESVAGGVSALKTLSSAQTLPDTDTGGGGTNEIRLDDDAGTR